ncbi:hypothetical protein CDL15_Pgr002574 [Punica granatum]|uniref:Uncharacterized protein n=1 Tax=Punica granatum TaxID=22663 RepID=A0A218WN94_PUNGR|nr:hypothetical protein CDL15_Pgr002574 [Punica granatum]
MFSSQLRLKLPVVRNLRTRVNKLATESISFLPDGPQLYGHSRLGGAFGFRSEGRRNSGSRGGLGPLRRRRSRRIKLSHVC